MKFAYLEVYIGGSMSDDRKVIELNVEQKQNTVEASPGDLKTAVAGSIALVLFIMTGVNFSLFDDASHIDDSQRGIASIQNTVAPKWKKSLSQINKGMVSDVARKPSAVDDLSYGDLEGRYALKIRGGQVTSIEFAEQGEPKALTDRTEFLQRHASVFANFCDVVAVLLALSCFF